MVKVCQQTGQVLCDKHNEKEAKQQHFPWLRYDMEMLSALPTLCDENPPVAGSPDVALFCPEERIDGLVQERCNSIANALELYIFLVLTHRHLFNAGRCHGNHRGQQTIIFLKLALEAYNA